MVLAEEYYLFRSGLTQKGIIFSFTGYVSENILYAMGEALKKKMALDDAEPNTTKKVFSVFVEQVQNIIRYSSERVPDETNPSNVLGSGVVTVGNQDGRFFVVCGNVVSAQQKIELGQRLEYLSTLDKTALKAYYKEKLREPPEKDSQGATIGLIEIARRSSEPVEYGFHDINPSQAFFCLKAYI